MVDDRDIILLFYHYFCLTTYHLIFSSTISSTILPSSSHLIFHLIDVSGCYILKPDSYFIWETIQSFIDYEIKQLGVRWDEMVYLLHNLPSHWSCYLSHNLPSHLINHLIETRHFLFLSPNLSYKKRKIISKDLNPKWPGCETYEMVVDEMRW